MNWFRTAKDKATSLGFVLALGVGALSTLGCESEKPKFTEARTFAGNIKVSAKDLNHGYESYMLNCYACHGEKGDGKGPASYSLRPAPRDFTKGIFKFARLSSSDELPNDEDLIRIVKGGLHGTAMLPWDVPTVELANIIHYIKTFAPQKWEKRKKNGEPVKVLDTFDAGKDPWLGRDKEAIEEGRDLYHFRAECVSCHPYYGGKEELYKRSLAAALRDKDKFKPLAGFRKDMYGSSAKDSQEYAQRILPPDFTFSPIRSVHAGSEVEDLYRLISYGVYPVMPKWKGAGLSDSDLWALAHYVKSLMDLRDTKVLATTHVSWTGQQGFEIPKAAPPPPAEPEKKEGDAAAEPPKEGDAAKTDEPKAAEKTEEGKKDEGKKDEGEKK